MISDPNAIVPRWYTVALKIELKSGTQQASCDLSLVQYHLANTPARTISPNEVTKFIPQYNAKRLNHCIQLWIPATFWYLLNVHKICAGWLSTLQGIVQVSLNTEGSQDSPNLYTSFVIGLIQLPNPQLGSCAVTLVSSRPGPISMYYNIYSFNWIFTFYVVLQRIYDEH